MVRKAGRPKPINRPCSGLGRSKSGSDRQCRGTEPEPTTALQSAAVLVSCVDDGVLTIPLRGIAIVLPPLRSLPLCSPRARSLALDLNRIAPGSPPAQSMPQGTRSLSMNGAGDDRVGSTRHQRYRRLVPVTTINQAGISRDPRGCGPIFPNEADRRARCLLSRGACGRSHRGQRRGFARKQPHGEFAIAANLVALHRLISGFPRVGRHLVRGPAGASFAAGKGGHSVVFGSPGSAIVAAQGSLSATPRTTYATSPVS